MSEDVTNFLKQVRELGDRRIEEDEARSRELEEKILMEKRERQARRAERARSISPQKSSPANTPPLLSARSSVLEDASLLASSLTLDLAPDSTQTQHTHNSTSESPVNPAMDCPPSSSPTKENESPFDADPKRPSTTSQPRASPLSWQRRPNSQAGSRSRPLSMVAAENAARSTDRPAVSEESLSKDQIAHALSSKDPAWFRQTPDRGQGSAAFRRSQVEDQDTLDMSSLKTQLPGMSRESSAEPQKDDLTPRIASSATQLNPRSPFPLTPSQKLDPPAAENASVIAPEPSPVASGRISPVRPSSPTKGAGGFVQSAMMKRSDSVSKRWSVQTPGLTRAGSIASNRNSRDLSRLHSPKPSISRPISMIQQSTSNTHTADGSDGTSGDNQDTRKMTVDTSLPSDISDAAKQGSDKVTPPPSPSRGNSRRWSPTKSSWLEAALSKPESPKPKPVAPTSQQPSWMVELNKAKAQKANNPGADLGPSPTPTSHKHEVSIGGLMRTSAPGTSVKPPATIPGMGAAPPPSATSVRAGVGSLRGNLKSTPNLKSAAASTSSGLSGLKPEADSVSKPKPQTPPKKDFRSNLKPRQASAEASSTKGEEKVEFKNVFGNLRRAKTQNYVAPDELKDNILRGKAALNTTGGPKKSERKDEFKEAILKKKEEFKKAQLEGRTITKKPSNISNDGLTPEGLASRTELAKSHTGKSSISLVEPSSFVSRQASTESLSAKQARPPQREGQDDTLGKSSEEPRVKATKSISDFQSNTRGRVSTETIQPALKPKEPPKPAFTKEINVPGRLQGKAGGSLADRFNPALAGLLARGPPAAASGPSQSTSGSAGETGSRVSDEAQTPGPQLTHMTKNRARGPRRKAPSTMVPGTASNSTEKQPRSQAVPESAPKMSPTHKPASLGNVISLVDSSKRITDDKPAPKGSAISLVDSPRPKLKPDMKTTLVSDEPAQLSMASIHEQVAIAAAAKKGLPPPRRLLEEKAEERMVQPPSPKKLDMSRVTKWEEAIKQTQKEAEPTMPITKKRIPTPEPKSAAKPVSVVEKPVDSKTSSARPLPLAMARPLPEPMSSRPLPKPTSPLLEAGVTKQERDSDIGSVKNGPPPASPKPPVSPKPVIASQPMSTPKFSSRPLPTPPSAPTPSPLQTESPLKSPSKPGSEVSTFLNDFFGPSRPKRDYHVDTTELLSNKLHPSTQRIRTMYTQLFQVSDTGKKTPVPAHYERVLFEREMYLCPHSYQDTTGKEVTEVYFWAGDEVPLSQVEDAEVFVNREARNLGGKLVKLRQGKETPEFLQALGGIVIVRRGSSNKYDSLAPNMLCCRRYMGQIAFDEVDHTASSLCSGFPFLVTQQGRCWLWKGRGADIEELSCARLIGMDLTLTGELNEVEEGSEPEAFWMAFEGEGAKRRGSSADHWRLKPRYEKYAARLFVSEAGSRGQIHEISPFTQSDLSTNSIYIVDAFFELYIIVGSRAQQQYPSFHNALDFAQEYAILSASMEDRPFMPVSTVVLGGIPRDLKAAFRKWEDSMSPTATLVQTESGSASAEGGGLKRGRSLRVVTLSAALQALSE